MSLVETGSDAIRCGIRLDTRNAGAAFLQVVGDRLHTLKQVRAISFDLDDTLWPIFPVIHRAEAALGDWLREHAPSLSHRINRRSLQSLRDKVLARHPESAHDLTFLRKQTLTLLLAEAGHGAEVVDAAFRVFWLERNAVEFFPDAVPALERLAQRFRLLAATNGNADLGHIGIGHLFEHTVTAIDAGAAKPAAAVFREVVRRTGLAPDQVLHVGDDPNADVLGARRAGLPAIWLNRGAQRWPHDNEPAPQQIRNLDQLEALLA